MSNQGYELGWDSTIENDGPEFILLPAGDYDFTVMKLERSRYQGGAKLPACNKAEISIECRGLDGTKSTVKHTLFLHSSVEGLLCAFFAGIGARKHGERISMNWNVVVGATGRCQVGTRTFQGKDGKDVTINEIKKFYEQDTASAPQTKSDYTPGRF